MSGEGASSGPAKVVMVYHHEPEEFYLERPVEVEDRLPSRREVDGSS